MKIDFFNKTTALIFLFLLLSNGFSAFAQAKRGKPVATKTAAPAAILASETSEAMNAAWKNGNLPAPLPVPGGGADEAIAVLAQKIAAKNDESIPALLTALQMAGFFVTGRDGKILFAPADGKGLGLPVNGWEIASAAKMFGDEKRTNLAELGERLKSVPEFAQADVAALLLEGVRRNAENAQNKHLRAWARLIVELGKNSAEKYDLAGGANAGTISLDAVQHLLIMRRLYGDLFALSEKFKPNAPSVRAAPARENSTPFVKASFDNNDFPIFAPASFKAEMQNRSEKFDRIEAAPAADEKQIPCRMDGSAPTIMDASATIIGVGFGELTGYLEDAFENTPAGDNIKKFSRITGIMNILLAYAKFIQTYASLESKIVLEDAPPLVRTKNSQPGGRKKLRTEVRIDIGNWQMYNCIRMAMNVTTGVDFATMNDGPLGDVGIRWHLDEGGAGDVYSNSGGKTGKEQIVGFAQDGAIRIQDQGTNTGTGANSVKDLTFTKTDEKGIARIILEGTPQKNFKSDRATAVTKQAKIRTTIRMKAGEIKGDMVDVAGQAIAGIPGLITMPAELLYRMDWASLASLTVPVRDWEECDGKGWNGTIEVSYRKTESLSEKPKEGDGIYQYKWSYNYNAFFNVKDSPEITYEESGDRYATLSGSLTAEASRVTDEKKNWSTKGDCARAGVNSSSLINERGKLSQTIDDGTLRIAGNEFKISFLISEIPATRTHHSVVKHFGWCGENPDHDGTDESSMSFSIEGITIEGTIDPKNPNQLEGSKSFTDEMGNEVVLRWSLKNCR